MRKTLVVAILSAGLLAETAVPVFAATSQSQTNKRRSQRRGRSKARRRRARNVGIGAGVARRLAPFLAAPSERSGGLGGGRQCEDQSAAPGQPIRPKQQHGFDERGFDQRHGEMIVAESVLGRRRRTACSTVIDARDETRQLPVLLFAVVQPLL